MLSRFTPRAAAAPRSTAHDLAGAGMNLATSNVPDALLDAFNFVLNCTRYLDKKTSSLGRITGARAA